VRVGDRVEILDGINPGDIVIVSPGGLADGSLVTISQ
jgi:hypothetical protein